MTDFMSSRKTLSVLNKILLKPDKLHDLSLFVERYVAYD